MPTLVLTAEQTEQVQPILELQKTRKIGCLAVVNIGFNRLSGERATELTFTALEWSDAVSLCAKIKKLALAN
jgi:hypothetical protein